jgi:hypothetical protein
MHVLRSGLYEGKSISKLQMDIELKQIRVLQGISGFLDFIHRPVFEGIRRFGNWICFCPQVKGGEEDTYSVGPLRKS